MTKPNPDTQRMATIDPDEAEASMVRRFHYDTDPNAVPSPDLELLRGVNRAHDRREAHQEDLDVPGLDKVPTPVPSDPARRPRNPRDVTTNPGLRHPWRIRPLPRDKLGLTYLLYGFIGCGLLSTFIIVVTSLVRHKKTALPLSPSYTTTPIATSQLDIPPPPVVLSVAPPESSQSVPTASAIPISHRSQRAPAPLSSQSQPLPTTLAAPPPEFRLLKPK